MVITSSQSISGKIVVIPIFFILIIGIGLGIWKAIPSLSKWNTGNEATASLPLHQNFVPRAICGVAKTVSYADKDLSSTHETIKITLVEGCYADWYVVPQTWEQYEVQLSQNVGDYASIWCNGHADPYPIVESYTRGVLRAEMYGCHAPGQLTNEFHFQGHGVVTLIGLTKRQRIPVTDEGYPTPTPALSPAL